MKHLSIKSAWRILIVLFSVFYGELLLAQDWASVPGIKAQDIGVGKNGVVWATGKTGSIYRLSGTNWETIPGGASRVAVDPLGAAWVVNTDGVIYKYNLTTSNWEIKPGLAKDIAVGADGSVWVIGIYAVSGGYEIYKWNGSGWNKIPGGAVRIAVDPSGNAWIVNNSNNVFAYNGSAFVMKPGAVSDIGIGAGGNIWCTGTDKRVYQWDGINWKMQTGGATQVSVAPDGNAWVVNDGGDVWHSTNAVAASLTIRTLFTRNQTYEYRMLQALKISPYANTIGLGGAVPAYSSIDPLGQAFGRLGLLAAEIYASQFPKATAASILSDMNNFQQIRQTISGILAVLVINEISKSAADQQGIALKSWATDLFYSIKVRSAKSVLNEYTKWKTDPCGYTADGYKAPPDCALKGLNFTQWYGTHSPPQDIIGNAGLKSVLANNADAIANGVALGITAITMTASAVTLASSLGAIAGIDISLATTFGVELSTKFMMVGAVGSAGWAGIVAAPVAAAVLAIVVGTIEGFRVVEQAKVEPTLKMKLGAAMLEPINISNAMADSSARTMFLFAFQEAAQKGFQITAPKVDGEVRFYCQAGYVSSFRLSYTLNGQTQTFTTPDLPVGQEKSFPIPYNATNIRVQGWASIAGWKELFNQTLAAPTFICYTSYGTIFAPTYKTDCPEVGNMTTQKNELTVTQGGGYSAWIRLTYVQNGQTVTALDQSSATAGWQKVFSIPAGTTNIHLEAWSSTGLLWDPWKSIIDKTWPYPPNECIKVYGTTTDPKWDNECN